MEIEFDVIPEGRTPLDPPHDAVDWEEDEDFDEDYDCP